jgi:NitT/TauT family transport system permease protein
MLYKQYIILVTLYLVVPFIIWDYLSYSGSVPSFLLPSPGRVLTEMLTRPGWYFENFRSTGIEAGIGAAASIFVGATLAWALGYSKRLEYYVSPLLVASQVFPKEALAPIILLIAGYGLLSKILVSFLLSFFPVVISTLAGVKSTPIELIDYAVSLGLSRRMIYFHFHMPHSLPALVVSIRVACTLSVIGAVVGEFIGSQTGLGYVIRSAASDFAIERVYTALLLLGVLGSIFYVAAGSLQRLIARRFSAELGLSTNSI